MIPARKDLLMDIGTEELSHLEIVGTPRSHASQAAQDRFAKKRRPIR